LNSDCFVERQDDTTRDTTPDPAAAISIQHLNLPVLMIITACYHQQHVSTIETAAAIITTTVIC